MEGKREFLHFYLGTEMLFCPAHLSRLDLLGYRVIDMIELLVNSTLFQAPFLGYCIFDLLAGPEKCTGCILPHFAIPKYHFGTEGWNWTTQGKNPDWSSFWRAKFRCQKSWVARDARTDGCQFQRANESQVFFGENLVSLRRSRVIHSLFQTPINGDW